MKELDLSEGHSSGILTIQEELEKNGSPRAVFFTDEDSMRIMIPIHPAFLEADREDVHLIDEKMPKMCRRVPKIIGLENYRGNSWKFMNIFLKKIYHNS